MKLSQAQIEQLKKLISYKGYPEIDVQYEILDHVACEVEKLMEEYTNLSLEDAFRKVHASFDIFGFSTLEESYKKMIENRVWKNYLEGMKDILLSFRIIFPIILGILIYQISLLVTNPKGWILVACMFLLLSTSWFFFSLIRNYKSFKNYASFTGTRNLFQIFNLGQLITIYIYQYIHKAEDQTSFLYLTFQALIIPLLVWLALSMFVLPKVLNQSIQETEKLKSIYEG